MKEAAIVLCGGSSTRMGRDKALLPFGQETLVARVVRIARSVTGEVVTVASPAQPLPDVGRVVRDPVEHAGPLAGLVTGFGAVDSDRVLLLACDLPLLVPALLRRILDRVGEAAACVPVIDGMPMPTCAVYASRVAPIAVRRLAEGHRSLRGLLDEIDVRWLSGGELHDVDPELISFLDCDTPEAYAEALARGDRGGIGNRGIEE
jgi:molybdopterin-guanine dinucleotide biosynthesis protein A